LNIKRNEPYKIFESLEDNGKTIDFCGNRLRPMKSLMKVKETRREILRH